MLKTTLLGFPRIGKKRELKSATEAFWKGKISVEELQAVGVRLRRENWEFQHRAGINLLPSNDFSFYDHVLDTCAITGVVPERFKWQGQKVDLSTCFYLARGIAQGKTAHSAPALEMTKWFDTNYHYLVPEFGPDTEFRMASLKPIEEFQEALALGIKTKPVLLGPVSFLKLGKFEGRPIDKSQFLPLLEKLLPVYGEILRRLDGLGADWVQFDEPVLASDLEPFHLQGLKTAYDYLASEAPKLNVLLASYFGELRENLYSVIELPVKAFHIDAVRAPREVDAWLEKLPEDKLLSVGIVDGRNIFARSLKILKKAYRKLGEERLLIAPSCSLLHVPISLEAEDDLDDELKQWLAFAEEKVGEVVTLARALEGRVLPAAIESNARAARERHRSPRIHNPAVKSRAASIAPGDSKRSTPFAKRLKLQRNRFPLPSWPTTTIGSFPQTIDVRRARARYRRGELSAEKYKLFIEEQIRDVIKLQERLGLDLLVHGEFERNDMVEYFGQQLEGFAFTRNGWVQSYGSRYVKPPIIFGDVSRPKPMTVAWIQYAQSLTDKPVKGMLTGPVTILQWSFVRDDQPRSDTARQIALAIRDEVRDLEHAGISFIQIDEPALREGLPLRKDDWTDYLNWAVEAFRLASSGVKDDTQIHTHMCYSEFNEIIEAIAELDADVISIEASRSKMNLLKAFGTFSYPNDIGPGVWDIHSPRVPEVEEIKTLLLKASKVLPPERLWVNPDCGLKTRALEEVIPSPQNIVTAARSLREESSRV